MANGNNSYHQFPTLMGIHQIGFDGAVDEEEIDNRSRQMLARCLNTRNVIAFIGSGISSAYGCPTWSSLASYLVRYTLRRARHSSVERDDDLREIEPLDPPLSLRDEEENMLVAFANRSQDNDRNPPNLTPADRMLTILDLCDEIFSRNDIFSRNGHNTWRKFRGEITNLIQKKCQYKPTSIESDPLHKIMDQLEIERFITTNYDTLIEEAFKKEFDCQIKNGDSTNQDYAENTELHAERPIARSLVFGPENAEALLQFAVAAPGFERGVFHIHGKADSQSAQTSSSPRNIEERPLLVLTERDYQRIYVQNLEPHQQIYREALKIVFEGNPVLFLGYSLEEVDVLRPLRQFVAERARSGYERPLFALFERPEDASKALQWRRYLYTRYAIKVIYFRNVGHTENPVQRGTELTKALCNEIDSLRSFLDNWWEGWKKKPFVRTSAFSVPKQHQGKYMVRHATNISSSDSLLEREEEDQRELREQLRHPGAAVILLGQPGAGKGTIGQQLAEDPNNVLNNPNHPGYDRRFFATAHFTNDLLSIIDAAASFFLQHRSGSNSTNEVLLEENSPPLKRLQDALKSGRHLLVIGGLERLLVPAGVVHGSHQFDENDRSNNTDPRCPIGKSLTYEVRSFLELINGVASNMNGNIVLTSSMWPLELYRTKVVPIKLKGISRRRAQARFGEMMDASIIDQLHSALNGHCYAFSVIYKVLQLIDMRERQSWVRKIVTTLTAIDPNARPTKAIELALKRLTQTRNEPSSLIGLAQHVALFSTPVSMNEILSSYRTPHDEKIEIAADHLKKANLFILHPAQQESPSESPRFTAHTLVRNFVLKELGDMPSAEGEAQRFDLTGWSGGVPETLGGRGDSHHLTAECVNALLEKLEEQHEDRGLMRAAFGLIRSRWTATAIPRLYDIASPKIADSGRLHAYYDAYQMQLARLTNAVRKGSPGFWLDNSLISRRSDIETSKGYLYSDELAWLYNEQALVAFCQGFAEDADALLSMGKMINLFAERNTPGYRWCESEITLGLVKMELGLLSRAREHLEAALRVASESLQQDRDLKARAKGHLALVLHLQGHYEEAKKFYKAAITSLSDSGNIRATSIFRKHCGDLLRMQGKWDEAGEFLQLSVAEAQSGRYPDLVQYIRVAQASHKLANAKEPVPVENLAPILDFARRVGIPKLEWEAQNMQAQIALKQGEFDLAENLAITSLATAAALRLRLRLARSLCLAGEVAVKRKNHRAAHCFFRSARELAERQRYQLLIEQADEHLRAAPFS